MSAKYGVNFTITAKAGRPISVQSITPIGIVGPVNSLEEGLHFFSSVSKAKEMFDDKPGVVKNAINAIYNQAVETPIIISSFILENSKDESKEIAAIELLSKSEAVTGYRPNILLSPGVENIEALMSLAVQAERLRATAIIDIKAEIETGFIHNSTNFFSSKRVVVCYPTVIAWDTDENKPVSVPLSPYIAGLIARTDGEWEYGFSDSYSNRVINGISGTSVPIDFILGETCTADILRDEKVTTVIRYDGFRVWGGETTDRDPIWQDLARVRTFDRIAEACQKGVFAAIDRKANQLAYAKRSVEELCRNLTGTQVLIGYSVSWSKEKNTDATVVEGKFYLDVEMQNTSIVKTIELEFAYVDKYSKTLLADINN